MREDLEQRYQLNLQRVRRLVESYQALAGSGQGRRSVDKTDVLRAAVVFLHATLEDLLRTLLAHRWRQSTEIGHFRGLDVVLVPNADGQQKVTLADLLQCRNETVDDILRRSIEAHLERSNFNNPGDVKLALQRSGIDEKIVAPLASSLATMMSRRHQIVHRADRHDVGGSGNHMAASLGTATVEAWTGAVDALCRDIVARV